MLRLLIPVMLVLVDDDLRAPNSNRPLCNHVTLKLKDIQGSSAREWLNVASKRVKIPETVAIRPKSSA
jgi:hypothetical protein